MSMLTYQQRHVATRVPITIATTMNQTINQATNCRRSANTTDTTTNRKYIIFIETYDKTYGSGGLMDKVSATRVTTKIHVLVGSRKRTRKRFNI